MGEGDREAVEGAAAHSDTSLAKARDVDLRQYPMGQWPRTPDLAKVKPRTLVRARSLRRKLTNAETILWSRLRKDASGIRFRRQHPVGPFIADFACVHARLIVEIDGAMHSTEEERQRDERREKFLGSRGWAIVRVWNSDVYESLDSVLELIADKVRMRSRDRANLAPSTAARSPSPTLRMGEES
jgi:very-short-patch-repair endonuclease